MSVLADLSRLNVLIELFSECANATDLDTLVRVAMGRLRWVIDSDHSTLALLRDGECVYWAGTRLEETSRRVAPVDVADIEVTLIGHVVERGTPAGLAPGRICVPIQVVGRTIGAISFCSGSGSYTLRDIRLGHHAGQYLGALISRMDLEEKARRVSKRKDDILALLGHEIRNPLAPIITAVQLLKQRAAGSPSKELDVIERQAQHLIRLVDDLLDVARLTRGKIVLQRAPTEIAQVVARAVEMVSPLLEGRQQSLHIGVPAVGLVVDIDESRLAQVLSNLLSNAARYTPVGGHVGVSARRDGDAVVVEVSDDGVGISADAQPDIFELFVQGADHSSGHGGLGLGLVVVKQLTELHGGSVSVTSEGAGRGTTFTVRLPAMEAGSIRAAAPAVTVALARTEAPRRVLLVDDNVDALELLGMVLERAGHEVVLAHDASEALGALERFQPLIAVIDIGMPVMNGYELAVRIGEQLGNDRPYLVALTGYDQPTDRERSRAAGFNEHLVKPIDSVDLLRVISRAPAERSRCFPPAGR